MLGFRIPVVSFEDVSQAKVADSILLRKFGLFVSSNNSRPVITIFHLRKDGTCPLRTNPRAPTIAVGTVPSKALLIQEAMSCFWFLCVLILEIVDTARDLGHVLVRTDQDEVV